MSNFVRTSCGKDEILLNLDSVLYITPNDSVKEGCCVHLANGKIIQIATSFEDMKRVLRLSLSLD